LLYRSGPYASVADHWYEREDYRSPSATLDRIAMEGDAVIVDDVSATAYLEHEAMVYVPSWQVRYHSVARNAGRTELWSGQPLLDAPEPIALAVLSSGRGWLLATRRAHGWKAFRGNPVEELARLGVTAEEIDSGIDGRAVLFRLTPTGSAPAPRGRPLPMICGPGDPEGFFHLTPQTEGGAPPQDDIVRILTETGANGLYAIAVRSHGGDGGPGEHPFVNPRARDGRIDAAALRRWHGWLRRLEDAGVVTALFLYDDSADPFRETAPAGSDPGGRGPRDVSVGERAFVDALVNAFADLPSILWVVAEEYEEALPAVRASALAGAIREAHPGRPWVGVHQRSGLAFDFADDPAFDVFLMQWGDGRSTPDDLHRAVVDARALSRNRYQVLMSEVPHAGVGSDDEARRKVWAMAMAGAGVLVNGWNVLDTPRVRLEECGDLVRWFEGASPSALRTDDAAATGDAVYALRSDAGEVLLYASAGSGPLGVRAVPAGRYRAAWIHPPSGRTAVETVSWMASDPRSAARPPGFVGEVAVRLTPLGRS
jgi:hypothetical protein